mgnify:CR=1 FL=1
MRRLLPLLLLLGSCADPELEMRVAQLEAEVEQLKTRPAAPAAAAPPPPPSAAAKQPGPAQPPTSTAPAAPARHLGRRQQPPTG